MIMQKSTCFFQVHQLSRRLIQSFFFTNFYIPVFSCNLRSLFCFNCLFINIATLTMINMTVTVRINLFYIISPSSHPTFVCFIPVGLSLLIQHFQQVLWVLKFQVPSIICVFHSCRLFVVNTIFSTGQTSTPTRPVENVVLMTKDLQERNTQLLDAMTVEKQVK